MPERSEKDTIAGIASSPGAAAIGIVRVSGPDAEAIARGIVEPPELIPRRAHHRNFRDAHGRSLDRGIAILYRAPASYTGEDLLELQGHGGHVAPSLLLQRVLELGARPARPGEFTERAFLNGKLDLLQAEAVADIVGSSTARAARGAVRSLDGEFSRRVEALRQALVDLRARAEAHLDFPEEDIGERDGAGIGALESRLRLLRAQARRGALLNAGLEIVIAGLPNVGKSTLLNALCGEERAIVTELPGTTRDPIRVTTDLGGLPIHFTDTAGLREHGGVVEREGMRRARQAIAKADVVLLVVEHGRPVPDARDFVELRPDAATGTAHEAAPDIVRIVNKIDLSGESPAIRDTGTVEIRLSARTGAGLDLLRRHIEERAGIGGEDDPGAFSARIRHVDALDRVQRYLESARTVGCDRGAGELVAEELRQAQRALGEITGEYTTDELLGEIFSRFCIGK